MVELYAKLVLEGARTLESVPTKYRADVEEQLKLRKEVERDA